jgi:hypothetical protein
MVRRDVPTVRNWSRSGAEEYLALAWLAGARALDTWHRARHGQRVVDHQAEVIAALKARVAELSDPKPMAIDSDTFVGVFKAWGREDVGTFLKAEARNADAVRDQYGTVWVREQRRVRSIETESGADLDRWLHGLKRPEGMTDEQLRHVLRDRSFAEIIARIKYWPREPQHVVYNGVHYWETPK